MTVKKNLETKSLAGVLSRLRKDEAGNTIAIMAAAVIPVIGLVGGSVDMSRIYLTQSRLQAACDAGALMGRKVMAGGAWADNSGLANTKAVQAFTANFENGAYGTGTVTKSFTESGGKVTGTASVPIPMTLMKALGQNQRTIRVNCSAEMRIPNSDVMFVLDTTGSMDSAANGESVSSSNPAKITELRVATKCFYEILTQKNITDVTKEQCDQTTDPSETSSNTSQIRFGFVPYSINVNVGRLLPLDYMANTWFYQTRRANFSEATGYDYTLGAPSDLTQVGDPSVSDPPGDWEFMSNSVTIDGTKYLKTVEVKKAPLDCTTISAPPDQSSGPTTDGPYVTNSPTPVHPATSITVDYESTVTSGAVKYRYVPDKTDVTKNKKCYLQRKTDSSVTTTQYTATRPVTWTPRRTFNDWTYDRIELNVAGLKNSANNSWNSSLQVPIGTNGANTTINWDGCILERETQKNVSTWDTSNTSAQKDMAIDLIPDASNPATLWGPRLKDVLYAREDSSGNWTLSPVTTTDNFGRPTSGNTTTACPSPAKLLDVWSPTDYKNYINGLTTDGYTFHDIGMLWGARLISPTGIFATHNAVANDNVQRHMIFMTDGDTNANSSALSAYNVPWFDRLQTDGNPSTSDLNALTDARTAALCTAIKNMNISLWVVSYGADVNSATNDRLEACASPGKFFAYDPDVSLTEQFKQIAGKIAALRLTT